MHPVLLEIGQVFISSLWVLVTLGAMTGGIVFIRLAQVSKMKIAFLVHHFFAIILWGFLAGRIVGVITNLDELLANGQSLLWNIIGIWDRNFNFWGIVLGMGIALAFYAKREEEPIGKWLDMLTLSLLVTIPFGHIGSLMEGINYGKETSWPIGITFETFTVPYTNPIHPTQWYAFAYTIAIGIAAFLIFFKKIWPQRDGGVTLLVAESYALMRFAEEFFRGDEYISFFGIHLAHIASLVAALVAGILLFSRYNTRDR